jgi:phage terminase large subunit-like protein
MTSARQLSRQLAERLRGDWHTRARPEQIPPDSPWSICLMLAGRGWGKTRAGADWVRGLAESGVSRIALVGATAADVWDIMVEDESGILACRPADNRPTYEPSKRRITWANGAIATDYSTEESDRLRGPSMPPPGATSAGDGRIGQLPYFLPSGSRNVRTMPALEPANRPARRGAE